MTNGSTIACQRLPVSSVRARQKETPAAPSRILTSRSSNCARMSLSHDVGGSSGMVFGPKRARRRSASAVERPVATSTASVAAVCSTLQAWASMQPDSGGPSSITRAVQSVKTKLQTFT
jgi:hypothetical protein